MKAALFLLPVIRNTSIILGYSYDKTLGKAMVLHWSWRNSSIDHYMDYDPGSESDFKIFPKA
jgi:hypothetical protein